MAYTKMIAGYSDINTWDDFQAAKVTYFQSISGRKKWFEWLMSQYNEGKLDQTKKQLLDYIIVHQLKEPSMSISSANTARLSITKVPTKEAMYELFSDLGYKE